MAEAAGLALGVVALWRNCVDLFDVIYSTRRYGMDYELLCVKLEVERVRLLCWGDTVGLSNQGRHARGGNAPLPHARLNRVEVQTTVVRLLGCVQNVFEDSDRLREAYGLEPLHEEVGGVPGTEVQLSQTQLILEGVFKKAFQHLKRMAQDRQRATPVVRKARWAIHDRKKFSNLVTEIRGFNDSLASLFPDVKTKAAEIMVEEIESSAEIGQLRLLQEATSEEYEELAESTSARLEALGATVSDRTTLLTVSQKDQHQDAATITDTREDDNGDWEDVQNEQAPLEQGEEVLDELEKKLREVELYVDRKSTGALTLSVHGPSTYTEHVSAHVYWDQEKRSEFSSRFWDDREKGFVASTHTSFELYHKKKFMRKKTRRDDSYDYPDSEDHTLLDPEAQTKYENLNPGTVTVEGFGMECWDFEFTKPRSHTVMVNSSKMPNIAAATLLRRTHEMTKGVERLGWNPQRDEWDIKDFVGSMGIVYYDQKYANDPKRWIGDLYRVLNREDIFANFTSSSSVALSWANSNTEDGIGFWNFLWEVVVAKELARRLDHYDDHGYTGFTARILASLIVADLWLSNVRIVLTNIKISMTDVKRAETEADKTRAEDFKTRGNEAMKEKNYQKAIELYTKAIEIDNSSAIYWCNRSAASFAENMIDEAEDNAYAATQLDPKYAKAWSRLGAVQLKQGNGKRAKESFQRAISVAGKDATEQMRQGLKDAEAKISETIKQINEEKNADLRHEMHSKFLDQDWSIAGKTWELHSCVHERQVEGLLLFAERMKWSYMNELRDYAEDMYSNLRGGGVVDVHLHDWIFGVVLPGKWFSFKIMTALILSTPSISKIGPAFYYECGLSLASKSYWRIRTVLGRVLGCLPGMTSLCGWLGPCPRVTFEGMPGEDSKKPRHIRVRTRRLAPFPHRPDPNDGVIYINSGRDRHEATRIRADEEMEPYLADMQDSSRWVIPEAPIHQVSTCELQSIVLKPLPLDINVAQRSASGELDDAAVENERQYRASLVFKVDSNPRPITYNLYTNPVFVSLPPCRPGPKGIEHEVHMRELPQYQRNIWTIEQLKEHQTEEDTEADGVMVINATGKGAEILARAWCSERGKNAVIRRAGGPCFVCSVRAAGRGSLETGVLIWLD